MIGNAFECTYIARNRLEHAPRMHQLIIDIAILNWFPATSTKNGISFGFSSGFISFSFVFDFLSWGLVFCSVEGFHYHRLKICYCLIEFLKTIYLQNMVLCFDVNHKNEKFLLLINLDLDF